MYQYLIFDLDGTLTDSREGITKSVQHALRCYGIEENDLSKLEAFIGPPLADSFMEFYDFPPEQAREAIGKYREYFVPRGMFENFPYPGIHDMLKRLSRSGKKLAIASSKPEDFVRQILSRFDLASSFSIIVGAPMDETKGSKEEVLAETLARLFPDGNIPVGETAMIGDRKFDIQAAKGFGLASVGVRYGFAKGDELEKAGADHIVDSVSELEKLLMGEEASGE